MTPADGLRVARRRPGKRGILGALLLTAFVVAVSQAPIRGVANPRGWSTLGEILGAVGALDLSWSFFAGKIAPEAVTTVAYAVTGMTVALLIGIPGAVLGSGVLAGGAWARRLSVLGTRGVLGWLRAIDELIWALLFVTAVGFSPWAGILGIGLPYGATVGRVLAERLQDVPEEPLQALRSAGASPSQVLVYGRLPHALADVASYLLYRFECAVRAATILSFAGLGGLGLPLTTAVDDLAFGRMWTVLLAIVALVIGIDLISDAVRRRVRT